MKVVDERVKEVREVDFREVNSDAAVLFLDAYLFSRRRVPTAEDLNVRFGPGSLVYENVIEGLMELFKEIKEPIKFELWKRNMELVYGRNSSRPPWRRLNLFRSGSTPAFSPFPFARLMVRQARVRVRRRGYAKEGDGKTKAKQNRNKS